MKKFFSAVIVIMLFAAALFSGATYWFGLQAEKHYYRVLDQASSFPYIRLIDQGYDRGFLGAKASTIARFLRPDGTAAGKEAEPFQFTLVHDIHHGPWPVWKSGHPMVTMKPVQAITETKLELSPETQANLQQVFGQSQGPAAATLSTTLPLLGSGDAELLIPAFHYAGGHENKVVIDWHGLEAEVAFPMDLTAFTGHLGTPGFRAEGVNGHFEIKDVDYGFDIRQSIMGLYLGDASFDVTRVVFDGPARGERKPVSLSGVRLEATSHAAHDTIDYGLAFNVHQVMVEDTSHGPGVFNMAYRNLDAASLKQLLESMKQIQSQAPGGSPEEIRRMMLSSCTRILPGLLKQSPEIEITRLDFTTGEGKITGRAKVAIEGEGSNLSALNPLFLLNALSVHAELTMTDHLLESFLQSNYEREIRAEQKRKGHEALSDDEIKGRASAKSKKRLEGLLANNIILHEGSNYKTRADYRAGSLIVNDRPVTLQDLMK